METVTTSEFFALYRRWRHAQYPEEQVPIGALGERQELYFCYRQPAATAANTCTKHQAYLYVELRSWHRYARKPATICRGFSNFQLLGIEASRLHHQLKQQYPELLEEAPGPIGDAWWIPSELMDSRGAYPLRELRLRAMLGHARASVLGAGESGP
ncbi:hypothetical protein [Hymenobacter jejuensis]|uniref:Uncharacterized protein n=1 Tax=Hymenobacter jejuensis TaxID=2502781 RepID=A0A5B7ZVB1_9BACT|nr:hypothetical protein [Hymenobacter jejuensis]QDA59021.1 hypothetical protein FHG12_02395 [Hymenobacter jejuensis]